MTSPVQTALAAAHSRAAGRRVRFVTTDGLFVCLAEADPRIADVLALGGRKLEDLVSAEAVCAGSARRRLKRRPRLDGNLKGVFADALTSARDSGRSSIDVADIVVAAGRVPGSCSYSMLRHLPREQVVEILTKSA